MQNQSVPAGKLIEKARGEMSQAELAKRVGTNQQTIQRIESGKIRKSSFIPKIAAVLDIPLSQLIPDLRPDEHPLTPSRVVPEGQLSGAARDFPVHAAAEGGPGEFLMSSDPVSWVVRPTPVLGVPRAYGIIIVGESMIPEYWPGSTAIVNPAMPPERGATYVFYSDDGHGEVRCTIKHLLRWTETHWHVRQWNPPKGKKQDFQLSRREWGTLHRCVGRYDR